MFSIYTLALSALAVGTVTIKQAFAETHAISFSNNCDGGTPRWQLGDGDVQSGNGEVDGEVNGGVAWLGDYKNCENGGTNCGTINFTLRNVPDNRAFISLAGNHTFQYGLGFEFINGCIGEVYCSDADCGEAAHSDSEDDINGHLRQCATDWGIHINFC